MMIKMSIIREEKQRILESMFENILNSLVLNDDGCYIFKHGKYSLTFPGITGPDIEYNTPVIPTNEEIFEYFEDKIVSKIPYAFLFINSNLSIEVNIDKRNKEFEKVSRARKELDLYEAIKIIFFPTMKEKLVKHGSLNPKWIYVPSNKIEITNLNNVGRIIQDENFIGFKKRLFTEWKSIEGTAIDFLSKDIANYISDFKFQNPIPFNAVLLPQPDLTKNDLINLYPNRRRGFHTFEFYSYEQKIKYLRQLFEDFLIYYPQIIEKNFTRARESFFLYSNMPIKITLKTYKSKDVERREDVGFFCGIEKIPKGSKSHVELIENQKGQFEEKYISAFSTSFSYKLLINGYSPFLTNRTWGSSNFNFKDISQNNALPYTYAFIVEELDDILEKFRNDVVFDVVKPFLSQVENWIKAIKEVEKRGDEDYNIELKLVPTESSKEDGTGNDLYSTINAFENAEGGYIFLGVDEKKKSLEKIIGLNDYLLRNSKTLDQVKREIQEKCLKYLHKTYRLDADEFEGKILIRIRVLSNNGNLSWFFPKKDNPCAYIRLNGKKLKMKTDEITKRLKRYH